MTTRNALETIYSTVASISQNVLKGSWYVVMSMYSLVTTTNTCCGDVPTILCTSQTFTAQSPLRNLVSQPEAEVPTQSASLRSRAPH